MKNYYTTPQLEVITTSADVVTASPVEYGFNLKFWTDEGWTEN